MPRALTSGPWSPDKQYRFSEVEMRHAAYVGIERRLSAARLGRRNRHDAPGLPWDVDIEGAAGETLICRELGVFHLSAHQFGIADAGENYQVRTTSYDEGHLIVHSDDDDAHVFVLVTGRCGMYRIRGCITGAEAKRSAWLSGGGDYFIPQNALGPFPSAEGRY